MSDFKGKSKKSSSDGEIWNPTSKKITGKDGKDYTARTANPVKGQEPKMTGYYMGFEMVQPKNPEQKPSALHKFQTSDGEIMKIWGSHDLDKQLAAVSSQEGLGTFCQIQWNGYLVKAKSANKPDEILKQGLPADFYHDWEVIAGDHADYPPIKVEGAEVYKAAASNTASTTQPKPAATAQPAAPVIPETLEQSTNLGSPISDDPNDLPY